MSMKYSESHISELMSDVCRAITTPYSGKRLETYDAGILYRTNISYKMVFTGKNIFDCSIHDIYNSLVELFSKHGDVVLSKPGYVWSSNNDDRYGFIIAELSDNGIPIGGINLQYYGLIEPSLNITTGNYLAGIRYSITNVIAEGSHYVINLDGKIILNLE